MELSVDVVEANVAALHHELEGIYNVGTGKETSVNELFAELRKLIQFDKKEIFGPEKRGELTRSVLDSGRLHKATDWEPRMGVEEGLARTVAYFKEVAGGNSPTQPNTIYR